MKAFTLVELLVTVAVGGILAALSAAQFNVYRASAYDLHALSGLRTGILGQETYYADHSSYLPYCKETGGQPNPVRCSELLPGFTPLDDTVYLHVGGIELDGAGQHFKEYVEIFSCSTKGIIKDVASPNEDVIARERTLYYYNSSFGAGIEKQGGADEQHFHNGELVSWLKCENFL